MKWDELFGIPGPDRTYDNKELGPVMTYDALVLASLVHYLQPEVGIEYGCLEGHSAAVLCRGVKKLYCVEVDNHRRGLCDVVDKNPNIIPVMACMTSWVPPEDRIDFVYFDASHVCLDSVRAYEILESKLAPDATIAVHDTADWVEPYPSSRYADFIPHRIPTVIEERKFLEFLKEKGWNVINLSCKTQCRHGIAIAQR